MPVATGQSRLRGALFQPCLTAAAARWMYTAMIYIEASDFTGCPFGCGGLQCCRQLRVAPASAEQHRARALCAAMASTLSLDGGADRLADTSHLRAAGCRHQHVQNGSLQACLSWQERPATPSALTKYRQSYLHTSGHIYKHFGAFDDPVDTKRVYGRVRCCPVLAVH
jgi:hypothetical protein